MAGVTDGEHSPPAYPSTFDQAIAQHVERLLEDRQETVYDLAHYSRISVAALYRKLGGGARWSAADVGRIAEHFGVRPGELFDDDAPNRAAPPPPVMPPPRAAPPSLTQPFSDAGSPHTAPV